MDKKLKKAGFFTALALCAVAGYMAGRTPSKPHIETQNANQLQNTVWTCSMHPQIRQPNPGKCPICAMDLIKVTSDPDGHTNQPDILKLSPNALARADIQTSPVERKFVSRQIRLNGKVEYDETLKSFITARMPGRIEKMFVNYTGISVKKGDHLFTIYSPELITAQQELLQAIDSTQTLAKSNLEVVRQSTKTNVETARSKLLLLGLTPKQVSDIEQSQKLQDHITVYSPTAGIITQKHVTEGDYVKEGTRIYTIADLSRVWVVFDAYESDLAWLRFGQQVSFTTKAWPGRTFKARIVFIDPVVNEKTHTVQVRLNVDNGDFSLKPGMFTTGEVKAVMGKNGVTGANDLKGKWISPMHPEIIKNAPGKCDVCGMDLVPAEKLIPNIQTAKNAPVVVPASAVLLTGKTAVVYVQYPWDKSFEARTVTLGPKAGDYYIIKHGLAPKETVVTNGAFKIDSEMQIRNKTSMMSPPAKTAKATAPDKMTDGHTAHQKAAQ